jgi:malonyl-CoA decarboxylase
VTLSPVSGFTVWLAGLDDGSALGQEAMKLAAAARPGWQDDAPAVEAVKRRLPALAAEYLIRARNVRGQPHDPVARFHLGNGARLESVNLLGDRSPKAIAESYGLMVNYQYKLDDLVKNHERFATRGEVVAAPGVRRLLAERFQKENSARVPA